MSAPVIVDDIGIVDFTVKGQDGTAVTVAVDLFSAWTRIRAAGVANAGEENATAYLEAIRGIMGDLGFPAVSLYGANAFSNAVRKHVRELMGKDPNAPAQPEPSNAPA